MDHHQEPDNLIRQQKPDVPVTCFRPAALQTAAQWFATNFPGKTLYAVKANPAPYVVSNLYQNGITCFDVASLAEVQSVRSLCPDAQLFFMHPVKSRMAIERAYKEYGVRHFVFDSADELEKIVENTGKADDLTLVLRIAVPNTASDCPLSGKFGMLPEEASDLLIRARNVSRRLGISFHVGSQTIDPRAYSSALAITARLISAAGVKVDVIDVGGGFPSIYPGMTEPPALIAYIDAIQQGMAQFPGGIEAYELWCEPGRALVAESCSIIARVELRKDDVLYINDGSFGGMVEAMTMKFRYPVRLIRTEGDEASTELKGFRFYGPTCDSVDYMPGPFDLPADIREGDYIEIGQLGAYGNASRSDFNGFGTTRTISVESAPLATMYGPVEEEKLRAIS